MIRRFVICVVKPAFNARTMSSSSDESIPEKKPRLDAEPEDARGNKASASSSSILDFDFKKKRVRVLSKDVTEVKEKSSGIVYWMSRDCRVQDNWALLFAQKLALKNHIPLHVCFSLVPKFLDATLRQFTFMLEGLQEVEEDLIKLKISFHLLYGSGGKTIPEFVKEHNLGAVVCDFTPLRVPLKWVDDCQKHLPKDVPMVQVDAHNIVPVWEASDKQEYSARTIRGKINKKLDEFLHSFPPIERHPYPSTFKSKSINWKSVYAKLEVDTSIKPVEWATPGYRGGMKALDDFLTKRIKFYDTKRNNPNENALSNLSPWFHFGQISVQRAVLEAKRVRSKHSASVDAFCEEAIIRRELSDNFCFYNEDYDNFNGLTNWAQKTLNDHRKDKREYLYTMAEFEKGHTHDDLWNAAQIQMVRDGKMHGFLRMYWAKKILEWTKSPEEALEVGIYLNDKYNLDGRDPSGYVGVMVSVILYLGTSTNEYNRMRPLQWSVGGLHDQGWAERAVFGKVRFMNYQGCKRKFDVAAFVAKYGATAHVKGKNKAK